MCDLCGNVYLVCGHDTFNNTGCTRTYIVYIHCALKGSVKSDTKMTPLILIGLGKNMHYRF